MGKYIMALDQGTTSSSDEGREITLYRLFDMDMCLLSASCIMRSIQFEVTIEAEKDTVRCFMQVQTPR